MPLSRPEDGLTMAFHQTWNLPGSKYPFNFLTPEMGFDLSVLQHLESYSASVQINPLAASNLPDLQRVLYHYSTLKTTKLGKLCVTIVLVPGPKWIG